METDSPKIESEALQGVKQEVIPANRSRPPLLIVGIDPGTTVGYAALTLAGDLHEIGSERGLSPDELVSRLLALGRVVVLGTDKRSAPALVEKLAARFGARLVVPKRDLAVEEKRALCRGVADGARNDHELDAAASALFSFRTMRPLLRKIDRQLEDQGRQEIRYGVQKTLLTTPEVSIRQAIEHIDSESRMFSDEAKPRGKGTAIVARLSHSSIARPVSRSAIQDRLTVERQLLATQNARLKRDLGRLGERYQRARERLAVIVDNERARKLLEDKDRRIFSMRQVIFARDSHIKDLRKQLLHHTQALAAAGDTLVLKFLPNLSEQEWKKVKGYVRKGDIIVVEDPNTANEGVTRELARKCATLLCLSSPKSIARDLRAEGFSLLDGSKARLQRVGIFRLLPREAYEQLQRKESEGVRLDDVIVEYKKEREDEAGWAGRRKIRADSEG